MASTPSVATSLVQTGMLLAGVLCAQVVAVRHLPVETIPGVLRGRVAMSARLRPWLLVSAIVMATAGLVLHLR